jgi:cytochrome c biogenesis protein CcmG/thiol:disulfide interchange protein DsbE
VKIIGLNLSDENQDAARSWLQKRGNPSVFNIADIDNTLGIDLGIYGAPETFLINPSGAILHRHVGEMNEGIWQRDFLPKIETKVDARSE